MSEGLQVLARRSLIAGVAWLALANTAAAKDDLRPFDIPAQRADLALQEFARQAGLQVLFPFGAAGRRRAPAVRGEYTAQQAAQILAGALGLTVTYSDAQTITLGRRPVAWPLRRAAPRPPQVTSSAPPPREMPEPHVEEVVVTGTRLTSGFQTLTPTTALSYEQLNASAPSGLADSVGQLPTFKGSFSATKTSSGSPNGGGAQSTLNLRGLGAQRNLVLLNGQRVIAHNAVGSVDINMLPQALVRSVEVVTGGASAAYGSDAVSGVINFVLDTGFEGVKGGIQTGITNYGDDASLKADVAFGRQLHDGRTRLVGAVGFFYADGLGPLDGFNRDWLAHGAGIISNPDPGALPARLIVHDVRHASMNYAGLITSGPLRGVTFLPGGEPIAFDFGALTGATWQVGGDGVPATPTQAAKQERWTVYLQGDHDITDRLNVSLSAAWARSLNTLQSYPNYVNGQGQFTIFSGNPYLPAALQARMTAGDIASFTLGRFSTDMPLEEIKPITEMKRWSASAVRRLDGGWKLDAVFTHSTSRQDISANNMPISRNIYAAADAVIDPASGHVVCRSTLLGYDTGCVPLNLFGVGSVTREAAAWVTGTSARFLDLTQTVAQANLSGDLANIALPAGSIAFAAGVEHRREAARQHSDPISQSVVDFTGVRGGPSSLARPGGFRTFNPLPLVGEYDVNETYVEIGAPLLKDAPLARSLAVNAALRLADYSGSGLAKTWKVGVSYEPGPEVRLRFTRSRDIRGPNILERFNPRAQSTGVVFYRGVTTPVTAFASGNAGLNPEVATTTTAGLIYRPSAIPGLNVSIDGYSIALDDAIGALGTQGIVDQCAAGFSVVCDLIVEVPGESRSLQIVNKTLNLSYLRTRGLDLEAVYAAPVRGGRLALRALVNYTGQFETRTPGAPADDQAGSLLNSQPRWTGVYKLEYDRGRFALFLQERFISSGAYDARFVEGVDINDNSVPARWYTDITAHYDVSIAGRALSYFFTIQNLFDKDPPPTPMASNFQAPTNAALYDTLGRYVTTGLRFRF